MYFNYLKHNMLYYFYQAPAGLEPKAKLTYISHPAIQLIHN